MSTDVPTTLDADLDPEWLGAVLDDVDSEDHVVAVESIDISKTLAQKVRFIAAIEGSSGRRRTKAYCVKAHFDDSPLNTLSSEARFYGELAPLVDVRTPAT